MTLRTATIFAFSLLAWLVYFYLVDWLIMEGQGLPVGWTPGAARGLCTQPQKPNA